MKNKRLKRKIVKALEDKEIVEDKSKTWLVIIPFCSESEADKPEFKKYARNLLEVDEDFYKEILEDYKDYKKEDN